MTARKIIKEVGRFSVTPVEHWLYMQKYLREHSSDIQPWDSFYERLSGSLKEPVRADNVLPRYYVVYDVIQRKNSPPLYDWEIMSKLPETDWRMYLEDFFLIFDAFLRGEHTWLLRDGGQNTFYIHVGTVPFALALDEDRKQDPDVAPWWLGADGLGDEGSFPARKRIFVREC